MTIWQLFQATRKVHREEKNRVRREESRIDKDLPFGIHDDGRIIITPVSLLAHPNFLLMDDPGRRQKVTGFSRATLLGQKVTRIMLQGDMDISSYLWIVKENDCLSIRWFRNYDEIYPRSADDWSTWLEKGRGLIGGRFFSVDHDDDAKTSAIGFDRIYGQESATYFAPVRFDEHCFPDQYDVSKSFHLSHELMLYGRTIDPGGGDSSFNEYCIVSAIGKDDEAYVAIDLGIDLAQSDVEVEF